jgi:hypothetical protein
MLEVCTITLAFESMSLLPLGKVVVEYVLGSTFAMRPEEK